MWEMLAENQWRLIVQIARYLHYFMFDVRNNDGEPLYLGQRCDILKESVKVDRAEQVYPTAPNRTEFTAPLLKAFRVQDADD